MEDQYNMSSPFISGLRHPPPGASTSLRTHGSASGGSDASSALTYPSPGSTKMELTGKSRPCSHQFSSTSYEVSPTSASFSSREARQQSQSPSFERLHEGWTEETIEDEESSGLSSLPEERSPQWNDQYSPTFRRPSTGSVTSTPPPPQFMATTATRNFPSLSLQQSIEASNATDYRLNKPSAPITSSSSSMSPSTPKSQRGSIVSGLKKKLGNFKSSKEAIRTSPSATWQSPRSVRDEVQIVSANHHAFSPPPSFAQFSFAGRIDSSQENKQQPIVSAAPPLTPKSMMETRRESIRAASSNDYYADMKRPSVSSSVHEKGGSTIERLSSRMFGKNRGSILQRRSSSRTSFIEHTSFEDARRPSHTPSIIGMSSSSPSPFPHHYDLQDEEREELQGDCSPRSRSPLASMVQSPVRPARHDGSSSPLFLPKSATSTRASLELNFNAAHDKRWSTLGPSSILQGERRGSDVSLNRVPSTTRRGSDTSSFLAAARLRRNQTTAESATSSIYSNRRTSWQHNSPSSEPLPLDRSISRASSCSKRTSLRGQASQRVSEIIGGARKQSLTGAQISRPTSLISSSSASVADHFVAVTSSTSSGDNYYDLTGAPPTLLQRRVSSAPYTSLDYLRQSRAAAAAATVSPSPVFGGGGGGASSRSGGLDSPTFIMQQQQLTSRRPKFGLDLQLDAAAAFDSIPSPLVMRRTSLNPTTTTTTPPPVSLSLLGIDDLHYRGDLTGGPSPLRKVFPCTPGEQEEGEKELLLQTPGEEREEEDKEERKLHLQGQKSNSSQSSLLPSPRPPPPDTPQSPGLEEYELLDDALNITSSTKESSRNALHHSRSQDQIPWSSTNSSTTIKDLIKRDSYQGRPRSVSYSFI